MQWFSFQDRFWRKLPGTERSWHFGGIKIYSKYHISYIFIYNVSIEDLQSLSLSLPFFAQLDRHSLWHSVKFSRPHCFETMSALFRPYRNWGSVAEAGPPEISGSYGFPFCETLQKCRWGCHSRAIFSHFQWKNLAIFSHSQPVLATPGRRAQNTHSFFGGRIILVEDLNREEHWWKLCRISPKEIATR